MTVRAHVPMPSLLVGLDFRPPSTRALAHALSMLERRCASQVHVVHVVPGPRAGDEALMQAVPDAIEEITRRVVGEGAIAGPVWAHVRAGAAHVRVRELAHELAADMVVLGSRVRARADLDAADPYSDVSVLVAGDRLELESRLGGAASCPLCRAARETPEVTWPWCRAHRPRGVVPPRRLDGRERFGALGSRAVH